MGHCCSCSGGNKIAPLQHEEKRPIQITGNFLRGRGDGESDTSDVERKNKEVLLLNLDRHISGSSFSSRSCASRSIDDIEEEEEILMQIRRRDRELMARFDLMHDYHDDITHLSTENISNNITLDIDHPFAPFYKEDLDETMLSRPRSVGLRGRSSYARDILSQLSNYSECDSVNDGPRREDTPIPGKRGGSNMSVLSKRKVKRKGNISSRSRKSQSRQSQLTIEDSNIDPPLTFTPRSVRSFTPMSITSIKTDDGGDSLNSSCSSLSAIGEISESGSASGKDKNSSQFKKSADEISNKKSRVSTSPVPNKLPKLQLSLSSPRRENIPPKPPPRPSKRNVNSTAPKSAELTSLTEREQTPLTPKSADLVLGSRQNSMIKANVDKNTKFELNPRSESVTLTKRPDMNQYAFPKKPVAPKRATYSYNVPSIGEPLDEKHRSQGQAQLAESSSLAKPNAWHASQENDVELENIVKPAEQKREKPKPPPKPLRSQMSKTQSLLSQPHFKKPVMKPIEHIKKMHLDDKTDVLNDRPMAAKPRRPATAVEGDNYQYPFKLKLSGILHPEDTFSEEMMDEESYPDENQGEKFQTIIII